MSYCSMGFLRLPSFLPKLRIDLALACTNNGEVKGPTGMAMKFAVTIYLALVMAAGPWVCCCTATQLTPKEPAVPASHSKSCCCSAEESREGSVPDQPLAPTRPCSCQDERQPVVLASADVQAATQLSRLLISIDQIAFDLCISPASDTAMDVRCPEPAQGGVFPFCDARDILCILQTLRC